MSINSVDLLNLAIELASRDSEVYHRNSVSRAYYAAYHACVQWEKKLPVPGSSEGSAGGIHQQLINRLRNPAPEVKDHTTRIQSKSLSAMLDSLRIRRKMADYSLSDFDYSSSAENDCENSRRLLEKTGVLCCITAETEVKKDDEIAHTALENRAEHINTEPAAKSQTRRPTLTRVR